MKKVKLMLLAVVVGTAIVLPSCKKYEEGPALSLSSRKARVANTWEVESATYNGTDITSSFTSIGYSETYDKDGNYSYAYSIGGGGTGKWEFQNKDAEIKRNGVSGQSSETLVILKLKQKEFWYYYMSGNDKTEIHLKQK